jgi:hypothetical protein
VRTVSQQRHASFGTGAKWGFFIGAGLGALSILTAEDDFSDYPGGKVGFTLFNVAAIGGWGAGIGVGISALIRGSHVIYASRPTSSAGLTVSPVLCADGKGVAVSLRF